MNGVNFRFYRQHLGLTSRELATDLGVTEKTIRNWECSSEIPELGFNYINKQIENSNFVLSFFKNSSMAKSKNILICESLNCVSFFFSNFNISNISYPIYKFGLVNLAIQMGKDFSIISIKSYKDWLNSKSILDTASSRLEFLEANCKEQFLPTAKQKKADSQKENQPNQLSFF